VAEKVALEGGWSQYRSATLHAATGGALLGRDLGAAADRARRDAGQSPEPGR
jgi:hypothetical protein